MDVNGKTEGRRGAAVQRCKEEGKKKGQSLRIASIVR